MTEPKTPKAPRPKVQRIDLRQTAFLAKYLDPNSKTFNNIYQSALQAGYSEEYADNFRISERQWMSGAVGLVTKEKLVSKAKKVLDKSLDSQDEKIAQDTAKFIAKTDIEFSDKSEMTIKLPTPILGGSSQDNALDDINPKQIGQ